MLLNRESCLPKAQLRPNTLEMVSLTTKVHIQGDWLLHHRNTAFHGLMKACFGCSRERPVGEADYWETVGTAVQPSMWQQFQRVSNALQSQL